MKKPLLLATCLLYSSLCLSSTNTGLDEFVKTKMKKYHVPGVSIAMIKNGKISSARSYGYADIETKRKMTTKTFLQACSISKTTTSLAVLLTFKSKNLKIDAPVNDYLTSWQVSKNKFTKKNPVTVRMLLDHSAGIRNPFENFKPGIITPTAVQMLKGELPATNKPLDAVYKPGSKYEYCNGCYVVLQQLLEDTNHKLFVPLMQSLVLTPLKLHHSTFNVETILEHPDRIAMPYKPNGSLYDTEPFMVMMKDPGLRKTNIPGNAGISVGGLWTTPSDLGKYAVAVQNALAGEKSSYIPYDIAKEMVDPSSTKTRGMAFFIANKYGDETPGGKYFMHGGFNPGYLAILVASKSKGGDGAVIMINVSPNSNSKDYYEWGFITDVEHYIADHEGWK